MKCSFCGTNMQKPQLIYVKNDGKVFNYCSSKCRKNQKMGRDGKKVRWTATFAQLKTEGTALAAGKKEAAAKAKGK